MLDSFTNYFWQHPAAVLAAAIAAIIILIWMAGSGSRQRFITFKRTKETDQLARDLSRIAAALEKLARGREAPMDYLNRPIPQDTISKGESVENEFRNDRGELPDSDHESVKPPGAPSAVRPIAARAEGAVSGPAYPRVAYNAPNSPRPDSRSKSAAGGSVPRSTRPANSSASVHSSPPDESPADAPKISSEESAPVQRNPLSGTADLLGDKKKLDLPNPFYRQQR